MTLDHTPRRIVSLQPSATVILHAIGALDRLVACTKYCVDVCPEAGMGRTVVDDSWTAKQEQIVATRADLIIAAVPYQEKAVAEILKAGVRFLGLAPKSLADIYVDIGTIAGAVGLPQRGEQVVAAMHDQIERTRSQTSGLPRPRVFCEEWGKPLIASLVRRWRSGASGKDRSGAWMDRGTCCARRAGVLHSRRVSEYACAHVASRPASSGSGNSPGGVPDRSGSQANLRRVA